VSELTLRATQKGMIAAVRNCGPWDTVDTLDEFVAAADRAQRETDRAIETWQRWRRFDPDPQNLELGSGRVNVRHAVAMGLSEQRTECVRLLIGPVAGSA